MTTVILFATWIHIDVLSREDDEWTTHTTLEKVGDQNNVKK